MRFPASELLNGACGVALVVLTAGDPQRVYAEMTRAAQPAQDTGMARVESQTAIPTDLTPIGQREIARAEEGEQAAAAAETASTTGSQQASETVSPARAASTSQSLADSVRRSLGALGAAAEGGIDAYVPPIVRQRPKTPPLTVAVEAKPKAKVKSASEKKAGSKQALGAVTPASVKR
jgi:hypothetical protein